MPTYKDINLLSQKSAVAGTEKLPVSDTEYITPDQIVESLDTQINGGNVAFSPTWSIEGKYIGNSGTLVSLNGWSISAPFVLKRGETITIHTQGSGCCIIARTDMSGSSYTPLVLAPSGTTGNNPYSYLAEKDTIIALCGKTGLNDVYCTLGVYSITSHIEDVEEQADEINSRVLNNRFIGEDNDYVSTGIYGVIPGKKYRIYLKNPNWDMTGVTVTGAYRFQIRSMYNEQGTNLVNVAIGSTVQAYYDITIPSSCDYITIGGRATKGTVVYFLVNFEDEISTIEAEIGDIATILASI